MRQKIARAAWLPVLACASFAAQAQVTLFGVMDLSLRSVSNTGVGRITGVASGGNSTGRFGITAQEDLGDGMKAGIHLESSVAGDTGFGGQATPAGQFWDRRSTVSLSGSMAGELRLGRDFVPTYITWGKADPFGHIGMAGSGNLATGNAAGPLRSALGIGPNPLVRASNAIQYFLPEGANGFDGGLMRAWDEGGLASAGAHQYTGARLGYTRGTWSVSAATAVIQNDLTGPSRLKDSALALGYEVAAVKLTLAWRGFKFQEARQNNYQVAAWIPFGPGTFKAKYQRTVLDGRAGTVNLDANTASQWALGYVYDLSKRTALYSNLAQIQNHGITAYNLPGGPAGKAGASSKGVELGIRHNF